MIAVAVWLLPLLSRQAQASPSGLNNIPTADTPPDRVVVLQAYDTFGEGRVHDLSAGMKFGLRPGSQYPWAPRWEGGVDGHLAPDPVGPAAFQAKLAIQPWANLPALALGSANLAVTREDRDHGNQPFNYLVLTHDFHLFRLHGGYALQHDNNAGFVGADVTFPVANRPLTLRTDAIQIQNEKRWLASVGAMYQLSRNLVLEVWGSFPTDHREPAVTIKLDWIWDLHPQR